MSSRYKDLLNEYGVASPSVTQEVIDRCIANQVAQAAAQAAAPPVAPKKSRRNAKALAKRQQKLASKMGLSLAQWLVQAGTYYKIDAATFAVTSIARSPTAPPEVWGPFGTHLDAEYKVLQLIDYKYYDHFVRDNRPLSDFAW